MHQERRVTQALVDFRARGRRDSVVFRDFRVFLGSQASLVTRASAGFQAFQAIPVTADTREPVVFQEFLAIQACLATADSRASVDSRAFLAIRAFPAFRGTRDLAVRQDLAVFQAIQAPRASQAFQDSRE